MNYMKNNKKQFIIFFTVAIVAVLSCLAHFANFNKDVEISMDSNSGANDSVVSNTVTGKTQLTTRDFLKEAGYTVDEDNYAYSVDLDSKIRDVSNVDIKKKAKGALDVDGQNISYNSAASTVNDVLAENNVTVDKDDVVTPLLTSAVTADTSTIKVVRVDTKEETHTEPITHDTQEIENADLAKGTAEVTTLGEDGVKTITEKVTIKDGIETNRETIDSSITKEPVTQIVEIGTKVEKTNKDIVTEETIPFKSETKENDTLDEGTKNILTSGVNGVTKTTQRVYYEDGVEISRETVSVETTDPITEIVEIGTKKVVKEEPAVETPAEEAPVEEEPAVETPTEEAPVEEEPTVETPAEEEPAVETPAEEAPVEEEPAVETPAEEPTNNTNNSTETINSSDFDLICAIVAHEGGTSYEGSLAVISCVMNRVDAGNWGGSDAVSVLTAPGQFASYLDGYYTQYMGADIPDVRRAVRDCMEGGIRSHSYTSFRSYETSGSENICGNWYF